MSTYILVNSDATVYTGSYFNTYRFDIVDWCARNSVTLASGDTLTYNIKNGLYKRVAVNKYSSVSAAETITLYQANDRWGFMVPYITGAEVTPTRATVTGYAALFLTGFNDACKLADDATAAATHLLDFTAFSTNEAPRISLYLKEGERRYAALEILSSVASVVFDLRTGQVVSGTSTWKVEAAGEGWFKYTVIAPIDTSHQVRLQLVDASLATTYDGDGTSGIYFTMPRAEPVHFPEELHRRYSRFAANIGSITSATTLASTATSATETLVQGLVMASITQVQVTMVGAAPATFQIYVSEFDPRSLR